MAEIVVSDQQAAVIRAIIGGSTQKAAAATAGVSEYTVSRWANSDANYIAALNVARLDAWQGQRAELSKLLAAAREALLFVLEGHDSVAIVKAAALILAEFSQPPTGPVTVEDAKIHVQAVHKARWQAQQDAYITMQDIFSNLG